jgi:hypothetical protein
MGSILPGKIQGPDDEDDLDRTEAPVDERLRVNN